MNENPLQITIHYANSVGNPKNCSYPFAGKAADEESFREIVSHDHCFADFKKNRRSLDNFIGTRYLVLDHDNDHSDNPEEWITGEVLANTLHEVPFVVYTSRHHQKQKKNLCPRPRWHVVFPLSSQITDPKEYRKLFTALNALIPGFDENASDASRFFFGNAESEVMFHAGELLLDAWLEENGSFDSGDAAPEVSAAARLVLSDDETEHALAVLGREIPEGRRNATLHDYAVRLVKRLGDTDEAETAFLDAANRCIPLLPEKEVKQIWESAKRFYDKKISKDPQYIPPQMYSASADQTWEKEPIPIGFPNLPDFPADAFPSILRDYCLAQAEAICVPVDIVATSVLGALSLCMQGKYLVQTNQSHSEPVNLFVLNAMRPSERKSSVLSAVMRPILDYETQYNNEHKSDFTNSQSRKRVLEQRLANLEKMSAKGKADESELERVTQELSFFQEHKPLRLYSDDVTMEKLVSVMSENHNCGGVISSEPGIFEMMKGRFSKQVNFDIILKGYSGDTVRVERVNREGESIRNPSLTMLLMTQTSVLSGIMQDPSFRGRGLTARFLYSMPKTRVGSRPFETTPVPTAVNAAYTALIQELLHDSFETMPEVITLSSEARTAITDYHNELEPKLKGMDDEAFAEWCGKLIGNTLRIAALLCRASVRRPYLFDEDELFPDPLDPLVIDEKIMDGAIRIARYFYEHAMAVFDMMGADQVTEDSRYILRRILTRKLYTVTTREIMRECRAIKTVARAEPALNRLTDYG